jgi:hypothetical protein
MIYNQQCESDCADNGRNSDPTIKQTDSQRQPTLYGTKCYRESDILYIPHSFVNPTFRVSHSGRNLALIAHKYPFGDHASNRKVGFCITIRICVVRLEFDSDVKTK